MTTRAKIENGVARVPYNLGQLKKDNPNTSFPTPVPDELWADFGVVEVDESAPKPTGRHTRVYVVVGDTVVREWAEPTDDLDEARDSRRKEILRPLSRYQVDALVAQVPQPERQAYLTYLDDLDSATTLVELDAVVAPV